MNITRIYPHLIKVVFVFSMLLFSCNSNKKDSNQSKKLIIVITTGMIADAVKNIVADKVEVISLMGPGVDPHLYKVTQSEIKKLLNADIIFYNGLHLEGKMEDVLKKMTELKPVIAVSNGLEKDQLRATSEFQGNYDPHLWFSVKLWADIVKFIGLKLSEIDSSNASFYQVNTDKYLLELAALDSWTISQINTIPETQRVLITAHDAFGYFGREYGMKVKGLQGLSTVAEFGLKDVTSLVDFISVNKIKAVFVESSVSDRSINAVLEGCKAKDHHVVIGGSLYSDAMGPAEKPEGTYIGMVKHNVMTIVNALN